MKLSGISKNRGFEKSGFHFISNENPSSCCVSIPKLFSICCYVSNIKNNNLKCVKQTNLIHISKVSALNINKGAMVFLPCF